MDSLVLFGSLLTCWRILRISRGEIFFPCTIIIPKRGILAFSFYMKEAKVFLSFPSNLANQEELIPLRACYNQFLYDSSQTSLFLVVWTTLQLSEKHVKILGNNINRYTFPYNALIGKSFKSVKYFHNAQNLSIIMSILLEAWENIWLTIER